MGTRPQEIPEIAEQCMDELVDRCQKYRTQAEEYRNDCIDGMLIVIMVSCII